MRARRPRDPSSAACTADNQNQLALSVLFVSSSFPSPLHPLPHHDHHHQPPQSPTTCPNHDHHHNHHHPLPAFSSRSQPSPLPPIACPIIIVIFAGSAGHWMYCSAASVPASGHGQREIAFFFPQDNGPLLVTRTGPITYAPTDTITGNSHGSRIRARASSGNARVPCNVHARTVTGNSHGSWSIHMHARVVAGNSRGPWHAHPQTHARARRAPRARGH